ncbi:MAG: hypothetical protein G01um101420_517 [Parcubacteria group bacterium Gr01-1014_20]|nr:MAG: hypothetical protein G01um101420_517 [Parcubacteria group bacterium Gr01-1014_20]
MQWKSLGPLVVLMLLSKISEPACQTQASEDSVSFKTIVVGDGGRVGDPFRVIDHSKKISFVWTGRGKTVTTVIADRMWDEYVEKDPEATDAGCLDICVFKNERWKVTTVFFPTMYRQDGRIRIHESFPIPENLVWYENGEFHFAECSMVLVNYKMGIGMLETENKIAGLNAFLSIWYWPYLTFERTSWEPVNYQLKGRDTSPTNQVERPKLIFGKRMPYTGILP